MIKSVLIAAIMTGSIAMILPASAAQITIYGRIDSGVLYQNNFGDSVKENTFTLDSGLNTASRWGIKGSEDITNNLQAIFRLENRFMSDSGTFKSFTSGKSGRMFGGQSTVGLKSKSFGELTMGRVAGINSGSGTYDLQYYMDAFGGGTVGTGNAPVKSTRYDNTITYQTPWLSGFQGTIQYSLKDDGYDNGDETTSDVNHYYGVSLHYRNGGLHLIGIFEGVDWGNVTQIEGGATRDKKAVTFGGSYRFEPVTLYLQAQYFQGLNALDGFKVNRTSGSIEGYGIHAGTQFWLSGLSSWQSMVYWKDYKEKLNDGRSYDGNTLGIATKYIYRPSKTIDMYIGAGFSQWDRIDSGRVLTDKEWNLFTGITKYF